MAISIVLLIPQQGHLEVSLGVVDLFQPLHDGQLLPVLALVQLCHGEVHALLQDGFVAVVGFLDETPAED